MPIYEYACRVCGAKREVFQGIHDLPLTQCQDCHQPSLQKLVSASGFRLKGGGWYETDFKKEGDKKKNLVTSDEAAVAEPKPVVVKQNPASTTDKTNTAE